MVVQTFNPPTRDQLAKVAQGDERLLRAFEELFRAAGRLLPDDLDELSGDVAGLLTAPREAAVLGFVFILFFMIFGLLITALTTWVYCKIFSKAGYSWALGLLMLVPIANIVMPFVLGFGNWPILKELQQLKQQQGNITT